MTRKTRSFLVLFVFLTLFAGFFVCTHLMNVKYDNETLNSNFSGVVQDIKYPQDEPAVKMNDNWYYLGVYGGVIKTYLSVDDSLVKEKGKAEFTVYRKNYYGEYEKLVFHYQLSNEW